MNNEAPLVSVIIPVYNVRAYLPQCLENVINQSYGNLEILIIDDGSTDGSGRICDQYAEKDERIRVLHTENRGLASARNLSLEQICGEYISFLDSDDWMELNTIETLLKAMTQTGSDIVVAQSSTEYFGKTTYPVKAPEGPQLFRGQQILPAFTQGLFGDVVWNKLYRTNLFASHRFPDGHNYEDVATTWKLMKDLAAEDGTVCRLPDILFHFRARQSSITHTRSLYNLLDRWEAYLAKYEALPKYQAQLLPACIMAAGQMWLWYETFSKEERAHARITMTQMQIFSRTHSHQVLNGKYSLYVKLACLITQWNHPLILRLCCYGNKLRRALRHSNTKLYP